MRHAAVMSVIALAASIAAVDAQRGAERGEWRSYGGDLASTKYSPLDQITPENFSRLKPAWQWPLVDAFVTKTTPDGGEWSAPLQSVITRLEQETPHLYRPQNAPVVANFQATPLMVHGVLYFNTPLSQGVAVDARTGQTLWVYNPKSYEEGTTAMSVTWRERGVAYWSDGADERVFWGTGNGYLICVDAKTGYPCADFGRKGRVDLYDGLPRANRKERDFLNAMLMSVQSPPIVVRNVVITGSSISDRRITKESIPGWVRAFDVRTGTHKWDFHTVPQAGEEGAETWLKDSWAYSGNANVWTMMSADEALGYVYLPVSTPTNDYYGGHRLGNNLFGESLVCVEAATGRKVWHFQAVHHGLWDYDFPAAPNLLDVVVNGRAIKAVAQISKQGFIYAFDRVTGRPIWPIEERSVPTTTNLPGEVPSPTQPFPTKPAPFDYQGVTLDDLADFTPAIREMAIDAVKGYTLGPLFTPPTMAVAGQTKGTVTRPTGGGSANWSGAAVDPETGWLYVGSGNSAGVINFYSPESQGGTVRYTHDAQSGPPRMPQGLPLVKPPYSRVTAINMNTADRAWMTPLGNGDRIRNHPLLRDLHLPPVGGDGRCAPLLTKTLLVCALSAGGRDDGPRLVAYDKVTGKERASADLPRGAIGAPMTYMLAGKQYIALTIGGTPPALIALTLPEEEK
jgi:glucose dehydrogenase